MYPDLLSSCCLASKSLQLAIKIKAGVNMNLSEIRRRLKRDLKGKKRVMEHHQTTARPHDGTSGLCSTV